MYSNLKLQKLLVCFFIFCFMLLTSGCTEKSTEAIKSEQSSVCYMDWKWESESDLGDINEAVGDPSQFYVIVDLYLKNEGEVPVSANPFSWNLVVNGLVYKPDTKYCIYPPHENKNQDIEVIKGGYIENKIIYHVKTQPLNGEALKLSLQYTGSGVSLQPIKYY